MSAQPLSGFISRLTASVNRPDQYPSFDEILTQLAISDGPKMVDFIIACLPDFTLAMHVLDAIYEMFTDRFDGNNNMLIFSMLRHFDHHYVRHDDNGFLISVTERGKQLRLENVENPAVDDILWLLNDSISSRRISARRLFSMAEMVPVENVESFRDFITFVIVFARGHGPRLGLSVDVDDLPIAAYHDRASKAELVKRANW